MTARRPVRLLVGATALLLLAGCATHRAPTEAAGETKLFGTAPAPQTERELIRKASLSLETENLDAVASGVGAFVARTGGFVASSELHERRLELQLRVPDRSLEMALDTLGTFGEVESRTLSTQDVTAELVDLDARLANLRAVRDRLRQHLERATALADVVAVERELARVQGEIDALEARLKVLRNSVAMAEVNLVAIRPPVLGPLGHLVVGAAWLISKLFVIR